jgi:hypothetical protein
MRLQYVLVINNDGDDKDATPFQGWNPAVTSPDFINILRLLCCLPSRLIEITLSQQELLTQRRTQKTKDLIAIGSSALSKISLTGKEWITIFICLPAEVSAIKTTQDLISEKFLILSPTIEDDVVDIRSFTLPLCHSLDDILWSLIPEGAKNNLVQRERYTESVEIPILHGIVMPNQVLLESLGYIVKGKEGVVLEDHKLAVDAIIRTTDLLLDLASPEDEPSELIIYTPSAKAYFYDFKSNLWNTVFREVKEKWKKQFIEEIFRAKSFSTLEVKMGDTRPTNPYKEPYLREILRTRQSETAATSMAIATLSNIRTVPSLRFPNSVNLHASKLRHIETLTKRGDRKAATLLQKAFREYVTEVKTNIGEETADLISKKSDACTVCSDVPLEWVYFGKLPLMISHEVSKIPMTPGNFLLRSAGMGSPLVLEASALHKVLVVRSFHDNDPIKPMLEFAINKFPLSERLSVTIVDVKSEAEAIDALNNFDGYITVFDCHGSHGGQDSFGWLQFGEDKTNTWMLAYKARITPIVMLSACSTAPINGSHISVANGLLNSGALSVIGTFLPVNGAKSAAFIARILYRIDAFLPALKSMGFDIITWRTLISDFMQMSYATDVLYYFLAKGIIDEDAMQSINLEANELINTRSPNWYDTLIRSTSERTGISEDDLVKMVMDEHPLMETMYYCQFGTPEHIKILLRSPEELALKSSPTGSDVQD